MAAKQITRGGERHASPVTPRPRVSMFNKCNNLTINGGVFVMSEPPVEDEQPEDIRRVRVGDINLLALVKENGIFEYRVIQHPKRPGRVHKYREQKGVQRVYHAKVFPSSDLFTVMTYDGDLQKWEHKIHEDHERHPNLTQIFGMSNTSRMHSIIYHGALIPWEVAVMQCPTVLTARILRAALFAQMMALEAKLIAAIGLRPRRDWQFSTPWFSLSSKQLSVELDSGGSYSLDGQCGGKAVAHLAKLSSTVTPTSYPSDKDLFSQLTLDDCLYVMGHTDDVSWETTGLCGPMQLGAVYSAILEPEPTAEKVFRRIDLKSLSKVASIGSITGLKYRASPVPGSKQLGWGRMTSGGWKRFSLCDVQSQLRGNMEYLRSRGHSLSHIKLVASADISAPDSLRQNWLVWATAAFPEMNSPHAHILTTGFSVTFDVVESMWDPFQLTGTFMADAMVEDIYLWILIPPAVTRDGGLWVHFPPADATHFWSLQEDGSGEQLDGASLGLPTVVPGRTFLEGLVWDAASYQTLRGYCASHGLDPSELPTLHEAVAVHDPVPLLDPHGESEGLYSSPMLL
ncbi:MFS general substrate transporter [Mycena kentingensis (nom. inval.)]|nr:MFS general substrate transporter [Mycena kentingensis (nom. inval.)]